MNEFRIFANSSPPPLGTRIAVRLADGEEKLALVCHPPGYPPDIKVVHFPGEDEEDDLETDLETYEAHGNLWGHSALSKWMWRYEDVTIYEEPELELV